MLNKNFEKGITILEALVATAILAMIATFFISSSSIFLKSQQEMIAQGRQHQIADLIIQDVSEYLKSEFDPYGTITTRQDVSTGSIIYVKDVGTRYPDDDVPEETGVPSVNDLFLVEDVSDQFKVLSTTDRGGGNYEITVSQTFEDMPYNIANDKKVSFISFKKADLTCFKDRVIDLKTIVLPAGLNNCPNSEGINSSPEIVLDIQNLITGWQNILNDNPKITVATVEMSNENLFKVTLGNGENNSVLAKKFVQCAFNVNKRSEAELEGSLTFDFGGNIGRVKTGIMKGTENPVKHYTFTGQDWNEFTEVGDAVTSHSDDSCDEDVGASPCRQHYADLNTITVFLYEYIGEDNDDPDIQRSSPGDVGQDVSLRPAGCSTFITPDPGHTTWDQCANEPDVVLPDGTIIDPSLVQEGELSLWFIFSEHDDHGTGENERGYVGFRTANLPRFARVLVFDDSSESCFESIVLMADGDLYECKGGYDWGGAHDGLIIHLDKTRAEINDLRNPKLEITAPAWNIWQWKVLRSGDAKDTRKHQNDNLPDATPDDGTNDNDWAKECLHAQNYIPDGIISAHETGSPGFANDKNEKCWHTVKSTYANLEVPLSANEITQLVVCIPGDDCYGSDGRGNSDEANQRNNFETEGGFLRIENELIGYDSYDPLTGIFSGLSRGLHNRPIVTEVRCGTVDHAPDCVDDGGAVEPNQYDPYIFNRYDGDPLHNSSSGRTRSVQHQYRHAMTLGCQPQMNWSTDIGGADQNAWKRKLTVYNVDFGITGCQDTTTLGAEGDDVLVTSPKTENGRWYGWLDNITPPRAATNIGVEQKVRHSFNLEANNRWLIDPDDFATNDVVHNSFAENVAHAINTQVYDADPRYNAISIISDGNGSFPALGNDYGNIDDTDHFTVPIPKTIEINTESADFRQVESVVCD